MFALDEESNMSKFSNSLTLSKREPKISTRKCSICDLRLEDHMTTDDLYDKYRGKFYHPGCKALADEFTADVPGALADILRRTKSRVRESGYEFDLGETDIEAMRFLLDLWERQGGICPETGLAMRCDVEHDLTFHLKPSLDRIENDRGYVKDNVRFVTQWYQYSKSDMTDEQTAAMCQAVVDTARLNKKPASRKRTARTVASSSKPASRTIEASGRRVNA